MPHKFRVRQDELRRGSSAVQQGQPSLHLFVEANNRDGDIAGICSTKPRRQVREGGLGTALKNDQMIRIHADECDHRLISGTSQAIALPNTVDWHGDVGELAKWLCPTILTSV